MLSEEQELIAEAVVNRSGNNLTVALPGSGKSTTCVAGIVRLLQEDRRARPWMVTFTKAATISITQKLKAILSASDFDRVGISTFHSIIGEQYKLLPDAKKIVIGNAHQHILKVVAYEFRSEDPDEINTAIECETRSLNIDNRRLSQVTKFYLHYMDSRGFIDYNMACREVVFAIRKGVIPPLNITHLIVDEFQDTDEVQLAWMELHALSGVKVTAVGDDDQAIYAFRGGMGFEIMSQYLERFAAKMFFLSSCYRCGSDILRAAERLITPNVGRISKNMNAATAHAGEVCVTTTETREKSLELLVDTVLKHKGSWAILARNGYNLDSVEVALHQKGITSRRLGGRSIWDTPAADATLRLFKLALTQEVDDGSQFALSTLLSMGTDEIDSFIGTARFNLVEAVLDLPHSDAKAVMLAILAMRGDTNAIEKIHGHIKKLRVAMQDLHLSKQDRRIVSLITDYLEDAEGSWHDRLRSMVWRLDTIKQASELKFEPTVVVLTTLHSAKGLEWDNVAIIDVNHGVIPSKKADTEESLEEERRLMYVGMTRAIHRLEIYAHGVVSKYLGELNLDQALNIEWKVIKERGTEKEKQNA